MINKTLGIIREHWRALAYVVLLAPIFWLLMFFRLGAPTNKASVSEKDFISKSFSYKDVVNHPVQLPYRALQAVTSKLGGRNLASQRAASATLAIVVILSFYMLLKIWYTRRIALIGSLLFASSSWLLHLGHLATPDITFALPLLTLASLAWWRHSDRPKLAFIITSISTALLLYTPGMFWLVLAGLILQRKALIRDFKKLPVTLIGACLIVFGLLASPLVLGIVHSSTSLLGILGLPGAMPNLLNVFKNFYIIPVRIFIKGTRSPALWLGQLPYLNIFETVMVSFGVYVLLVQRKLDRTKFILGGLLIFAVLVSLSGPVSMVALLPYLMLLEVAGLTLLLQQWFTVFPRNPVARNLGVVVVVLTGALVIGYNLTNYFIAWPNTPETKVSFQQKV